MRRSLYVLAAFAMACSVSAQLFEGFNSGLGGWGTAGEGTRSWSSSFGSPPGSARFDDGPGGITNHTLYASGSDSFRLGPWHYGGTLHYDIYPRTNDQTNPYYGDIYLAWGGQSLHLSFPPPVVDQWNRVEVALSTASPWRLGTPAGPLATETEIRTILDSRPRVYLRADFGISDFDVCYLDNVALDLPGVLVTPIAMAVRLGRIDAGGLSDLQGHDGLMLRVCKFIVPNQVVAPINVEVGAVSPATNVIGIRFTTVSRVTANGQFEQTLEMYDHVAQSWTTGVAKIDAVSTTMLRRTVIGSGNLNRFVNAANRNINARWLVRQVGPSSAAIFCSETDAAYWTVILPQ